MEYTIDVDPDTGWGTVRVGGEIHLEQFVQALAAAWAHADYGDATCAIWDFSDATTTLYFNHICDLTDFIVERKMGRGPTTIAIVASKDVEFGVARMFAAFDEKCGYTLNVFRSREAAAAWLRSRAAGDTARP